MSKNAIKNIAFAIISLTVLFSLFRLMNHKISTRTNDVFIIRAAIKELRVPMVNIGIAKSEKVSAKSPTVPVPACGIPRLKSFSQFFTYGKKKKYQCKNLKEIGGRMTDKDGSKFVCFDKDLEMIKDDCVVLSFGIDYEWSFDDSMHDFGCTVYAFDPTMGKKNFDRKPRIHFYNLGLSDKSTIKNYHTRGQNIQIKVDRYENILKKLNLTNKKIDYLKMDIEGSEIEFLQDVMKNSPQLLKNVKQIGMEIHVGIPLPVENKLTIRSSRFFTFWHLMHELECHGFQLMHYRPNTVKVNVYTFENRMESQCYEIVWVNK